MVLEEKFDCTVLAKILAYLGKYTELISLK